MNYFLKRFTFFIIPFLLVLSIIEILLIHGGFSYSVQKRQLEDLADSIEVLILGPSYSYTGLNPGLFTHYTFNLSNNNQDIYYDFKLLEKNQPILKNLKIVIFNFGYQTLDHELGSDNSEERKRGSFYKRIYGIPRKDSRDFIIDYSYLVNMGFKLGIEHLRSNTIRSIKNGWIEINDVTVFSESVIDPEAVVVEKLKYQNSINNSSTKQNIDYLRKAIKICKENQIKVLLCLDPVTSFYRKSINPVKYSFVVRNIEELTNEPNVYFLNLYDNINFTDNDFSDMHHVNSEGAKKFTLLVNDEINNILGPDSI